MSCSKHLLAMENIIAIKLLRAEVEMFNLRAGDDIDLNANVSTSGLGSVHLLAANGNLDAITASI